MPGFCTPEKSKDSGGHPHDSRQYRAAMHVQLKLPASVVRLSVKAAMGAMISRQRFPEIIRPILWHWFICHLRVVAVPAQIAVGDSRSKFLRIDGHDGWKADP